VDLRGPVHCGVEFRDDPLGVFGFIGQDERLGNPSTAGSPRWMMPVLRMSGALAARSPQPQASAATGQRRQRPLYRTQIRPALTEGAGVMDGYFLA
jgi:hypothetical protein